jgi:hypothetical protein
MADGKFEALWKNVVDHWDDDSAHAIFLQQCQMNEQLAEAAARYAGMRGDRDRGESAKRRLDAVTVLATSVLLGSRTEREAVISKWFAFVVLLSLGIMAGYVLLRALR